MIARLMGLKSVDTETLRRRMQSEPLAIFDLNSRASWQQAHLPGSRHLDPSFGPGDLPGDPEHALVFYCSGPLCRKAPLAARRARQMGFRNVQVLSAGLSGWLAAGMPTDSEA